MNLTPDASQLEHSFPIGSLKVQLAAESAVGKSIDTKPAVPEFNIRHQHCFQLEARGGFES